MGVLEGGQDMSAGFANVCDGFTFEVCDLTSPDVKEPMTSISFRP